MACWGCLLSLVYIGVKFTHDETQISEVHNSESFDKCLQFCCHYHDQDLEHFYPRREPLDSLLFHFLIFVMSVGYIRVFTL